MNVFSLFEPAARAWRERPAVRYGDRRQSYGELDAATAGFAVHLSSLGLEKGDRVALFMKNGFAYPSALLGEFRGGFVAVPINAKLHPREAAYIIENAEAKAVVIDAVRRWLFAGRTVGSPIARGLRRPKPTQLTECRRLYTTDTAPARIFRKTVAAL